MSESDRKKNHIWQLAVTLTAQSTRMTGKELADDLNRNGFTTSYGDAYKGGRGTYTLIRATWHWLHDEQEKPREAEKVAEAFVKPDGTYAYK